MCFKINYTQEGVGPRAAFTIQDIGSIQVSCQTLPWLRACASFLPLQVPVTQLRFHIPKQPAPSPSF